MSFIGLNITFTLNELINPADIVKQENISIVFYVLLIIIFLLLVYTIFLIIKVKSKNKKLQQELSIRKETEKLFKKSEENKTLILNSIHETILFIDNDHKILWANKSRNLPIEMEEQSIIGRNCYEVFLGSDSIPKYSTNPTKETQYTEHYIPEKNTYLGWHITPFFDDNGKQKGFVKTIEDITEKKNIEKALLKAKEKAEESEKLKSAFLANMSHEIRTPMNAIIGFSELLNDSEISEQERKDYINIIQSNGHQLLKLISDILTSSLIESGQLKIKKKEINLIDTLKDVYRQFAEEKRRLNKEHIEIILNKHHTEDDFILNTDPERLKQVLYNLMTNALKFTSSGSITLGVEKEKKKIKIYISDTGCGIHPAKLKKIFNRFSQADDTASRKFDGAGLGLAISKEFVLLLGGKIYVESEMDKGSTFWIMLPGK